jgi:hypothetical protein
MNRGQKNVGSQENRLAEKERMETQIQSSEGGGECEERREEEGEKSENEEKRVAQRGEGLVFGVWCLALGVWCLVMVFSVGGW